jgi:hypothetical protein
MYLTRNPCHILIRLKYSRQIFEKKNHQISNFVKIRPIGSASFHADKRARTTKLVAAFRNLQEIVWEHVLDRSGSRLGQVVSSCDCGNEPSGSIERGERIFLD